MWTTELLVYDGWLVCVLYRKLEVGNRFKGYSIIKIVKLALVLRIAESKSALQKTCQSDNSGN